MIRRKGYTGVQISLHWVIALLVLFNYIYSEGMGHALDARLEGSLPATQGLNPAIHVWVGLAILALVAGRLLIRLTRGVPAAGGSGIQQRMAEGAHRLLYALLIAIPAFGALAWFGKIDLFGGPHALLANLLMLLAAGHALAAIWHQLVLKDGLLTRMTRPDSD